jgi:hypothetical protein
MKNAKATVKGWVNPKTGELLKAQKMTQEQADALNGVVVAPEPKPIAEPAPRDGFPEMQVEVESEVVEEPVEVESEVVEEPVEVTPKRRGFGKLFGKK